MRVNHKAGQDKLYERIRSKGIPWNYKRVRRVYLAMGLKHRQCTKRRLPTREKQPLTVPIGCNMSWSMDVNYPSPWVVRMLERVIREYGIPLKIRVDNCPELTCSVIVNWCTQRNLLLSIFKPDDPCKMPISSDSIELSVRMYWTPTSLKIFISSGKSPRNGCKITITINPMNHSTTSHP